MVKELNEEMFFNEIKTLNNSSKINKRDTVIEFYQKTCPHCIAMEKTVSEVSDEFPDIDFFRIDISDDFEVAKQFNIEGTPTFVFFPLKNNYKIIVGEMSKADLKKNIKDIFTL